MRITKSKKYWMVITIELENAYDRVRWDFLWDTLVDDGLPSSLIEMIMRCVCSSSLQLLWNGSLSEEFIPFRGIRQKDPLFLYLFVLGMKKLGHQIENLIEEGR